jgi:hypothetical protein
VLVVVGAGVVGVGSGVDGVGSGVGGVGIGGGGVGAGVDGIGICVGCRLVYGDGKPMLLITTFILQAKSTIQ